MSLSFKLNLRSEYSFFNLFFIHLEDMSGPGMSSDKMGFSMLFHRDLVTIGGKNVYKY